MWGTEKGNVVPQGRKEEKFRDGWGEAHYTTLISTPVLLSLSLSVCHSVSLPLTLDAIWSGGEREHEDGIVRYQLVDLAPHGNGVVIARDGLDESLLPLLHEREEVVYGTAAAAAAAVRRSCQRRRGEGAPGDIESTRRGWCEWTGEDCQRSDGQRCEDSHGQGCYW